MNQIVAAGVSSYLLSSSLLDETSYHSLAVVGGMASLVATACIEAMFSTLRTPSTIPLYHLNLSLACFGTAVHITSKLVDLGPAADLGPALTSLADGFIIGSFGTLAFLAARSVEKYYNAPPVKEGYFPIVSDCSESCCVRC